MVESRLWAKLRVKLGERVAILNAPESLGDELGALPGGTTPLDRLEDALSVVLCFATRMEALRSQADRLRDSLGPDGKLWICYPKLDAAKKHGIASDLSRDTIWAEMRRFRLEGVSMVAIDPVWSAMRFKVISLPANTDTSED